MASLKVLSWNIRQGGGTRVSPIVSAVLQHDAHAVVLSEFRNSQRGDAICSSLRDAGYQHQQRSAAARNENSVLVASRIPFRGRDVSDSVEVYPHNVVCAEFDAFDLFGVYLPHKKKHTWFDVLLEEVERDQPCIIAGDFNSGKNGVDQAGQSFWYEDKMIALEQIGYVDAFREVHGDVREFSWFSHQGNGYRYDHTFVHPALAQLISDCWYSHDERESGLSDHSVMLLELEF